MSKRHKRKHTEHLQKKHCVLCNRTVFPFESNYIIGATGRVVCRECLATSKLLPKKYPKQSPGGESTKTEGTLSPREILLQLDAAIIGQERAKRVVAVALWKQQLRAAGVTTVPRSNLLLYGPTGCGKTALVQEASKIVGLPFLMFDATTFSETGYRGRDASDIVQDLFSRFSGHPKRSWGIVFLDELDKLAAKGGETRVQYNRGTQHALLKLIEGMEVKYDDGYFSTDSLLFIFGGAFTGLGTHAERAVAPIGFLPDGKASTLSPGCKISTEAFVTFGMEPELMGRVGQYVPLHGLDADILRQILFRSKLSVYRQYQNFFAGYGIQLHISDAYTDQLLADALALGTGARGLNHLLETAMEPLLFQLAEGTLPRSICLENGGDTW